MKIFFLGALLFGCAHSMDLSSTVGHDQTQENLEAQKNSITTGKDSGWHFLNSLVQAIIYPCNATYSEDELSFNHYEHAHISYFESYHKIKEWLHLISESAYDLHDAARIMLSGCNSHIGLTELQKMRISRAWLHAFLNDHVDSPFTVKRKLYVDALKKHDHEQLALLAPQICKYTVPLLDEIKQRYKEILP